MKMLMIFLIYIFSTQSNANLANENNGGSIVSGGGDLILSYILKRGDSIVQHLKTDPVGIEFSRNFKIDPHLLANSINEFNIVLTNEPLIDRHGTVVDGLVNGGKIYFSSAKLSNYLLANVNIDQLILHELLRDNGYDDDDMKISKYLTYTKNFYPLAYLSYQEDIREESTLPLILSDVQFEKYKKCKKLAQNYFDKASYVLVVKYRTTQWIPLGMEAFYEGAKQYQLEVIKGLLDNYCNKHKYIKG